MQPTQLSSYDRVPYDSKAFTETHPDRLATVATLFGLEPPPVDRCRVLELGCADGVNLIPMAVAFPESTFVGVDLSQRQVAAAQELADACGLKNIALSAKSILDVGKDDGVFDYVLCHGVYSWVPPEVRDHILNICKNNLTPNGVCYISYNTYPGWHVRRMVRDILCYHARRVTDPLEQVKQARAFIDFLGTAVVPDPSSTYHATIRGAVEALKQRSDSYFLHEYLEEFNEPCYFHEFVERVQQHGLQYIADANLSIMMTNRFAPEVQEALAKLATDIVQLEQYLDFLTNRPFRRSLLCHQGQAVNHRSVQPEILGKLFISSLAKPVSPQPKVLTMDQEEFKAPEGLSLSTREPLLKAAMVYLSQVSPRSVSLDELWTGACAGSAPPPGQSSPGARTREFLAARIISYYVSGIVQLHTKAPPLTAAVSAMPRASAIVRELARRGRHVTNLRHEMVEITELGRQVAERLDGAQDRSKLLESLVGLNGQGKLRLERNGQPVTDPTELHEQLGFALDQTLSLLARSGCLVG